jgi:hypothetical protein
MHLQLIVEKKPIKTISICIYTNNIEDHCAELSSKELVNPAGRLQKITAGFTEFFIIDNDGNTLYFRGIN